MTLPAARTRLGIALISLAVIGAELALMRILSVRFWSHFAAMVISVALLGFGSSGTALVLLRKRVAAAPRTWLWALGMAMAVSVPVTALLSSRIPVNVEFLAWDLSRAWSVLLIELLMFVPFFLGGCVIGVALMDAPDRIGGHYAANLVGSGAGAVLFVLLMNVLTAEQLLIAVAAVVYLGAAVLVPWRRPGAAIIAAVAAALLVLFVVLVPLATPLSQYKMLSMLRDMPGTRELHRAEGPLGRIDVVAGETIHYAPGLSLQYMEDLPAHVLLLTDGDRPSPIYDCKRPEDWAFMDYTTAAAGYRARRRPRVLIVGAGGGADIGLAWYHRCPRIVALEMNGQVIRAMNGPLRERGGRIYRAPNVAVINREARGYLAAAGERFDLIQLPPVGAFGAVGSGVTATQESYLLTVESVAAMLGRLSDGGVLCITRDAQSPPRGGLRAFAVAAEAMRKEGLDPAPRMALLRSWSTVTLLAAKRPLTPEQTRALRRFARRRNFDLCYLPDLAAAEANQYHVLDRPYYFEAARAMLGPGRDALFRDYLFDI
ncbi:MAG TPA: hypothetical protein VMZ50_12820, partial [Phycisphaerae bacterium]|nr:hypothetical protein [Phycisphaerae bacterium]